MKKFLDRFKYIWVFAGYYLAMAMIIVLISKYLKDKGLTAAQIGVVVSSATIFSMAMQPLVGAAQEMISSKIATAATLVISGVTGLLFAYTDSYIMMVLLYGFTMGLFYSVEPYLDRLAVEAPHPYRVLRGGGTVGFAIGAQICGLVYEHISPMMLYWLYIFFTATAIVCMLTSRGVGEGLKKEKKKYGREVFGNTMLWKYMVILALFYVNCNLNITFLPIFYTSSGVSESTYGLILLLATLMELPVLWSAKRFMNRFSNTTLITLVFLLQILQFGIYVLVPVTAVRAAASVLLRSSTTMIMVMVNLKVINCIVKPEYVLSALTLCYAVPKNLISVVMQYVGGRIIDAMSYESMYLMLIGVAVAGALCARLFKIPTQENREALFD